MLAPRIRERRFALLPVGRCEGCRVWCFALGPVKKKPAAASGLA
jgi:hypothetical protein